MRKIVSFLVIFLFIVTYSYGDVVINEIMFNPDGNENDFEYIELYGSGNISGWYFEGIDYTFPANTSIDKFLIIASTCKDSGDDNDLEDRYAGLTCEHDYTGSLVNSGELIILKDSKGKIVDSVNYDYFSNIEENHSLERVDINRYSSDTSNWAESINGGSPGKVNSMSQSSHCNWKVELLIENLTSDDPTWQWRVKNLGDGEANLTIKHWVEDSFGNIVEDYTDYSGTHSSQKTKGPYSPLLRKGYGYYINVNITEISCEDYDLSDNMVRQLIYVLNEEDPILNSSNIIIYDHSPGSVSFGGIVNAKVKAYRGDTSKYALYAYVLNDDGILVSQKPIVHLKEKFRNYTLSIPVQLKPNCNRRYKDGEYTLIVDGMDVEDKYKFDISGITSSMCEEVKVEEKKKKGKLSFEILEMPYTVILNKSFETLIKIDNEDDDDVEVEIWSYVYRGGKRYSDEFANRQYVRIDDEDSKEVSLNTTVLEGDEGNYNFKVKMLKKGRKTSDNHIKQIFLKVPLVEKTVEGNVGVLAAPGTEFALSKENISDIIARDSKIVYESSTFEIKEMTPIFLLAFFIMALIFALVGLNKRQ